MRLAVLPFLFFPAVAQAERIPLAPVNTEVQIRLYGMGILPLDGTFDRFQGWLDRDPAHPSICRVELRVQVGSLTMGSTLVRDDVIGPDFLDGAHYPVMSYDGTCDHGDIVGQLDMRGVTRPLALTFEQGDGLAVATGRLERSLWGMDKRPIMGGQTVRIRVTTTLPDPAGTSRAPLVETTGAPPPAATAPPVGAHMPSPGGSAVIPAIADPTTAIPQAGAGATVPAVAASPVKP